MLASPLHPAAAGLSPWTRPSRQMLPSMRLSDRLAERLQALIVERQLPGGARLPAERSLAAELGVSRTSLREAIRKLAS